MWQSPFIIIFFPFSTVLYPGNNPWSRVGEGNKYMHSRCPNADVKWYLSCILFIFSWDYTLFSESVVPHSAFFLLFFKSCEFNFCTFSRYSQGSDFISRTVVLSCHIFSISKCLYLLMLYLFNSYKFFSPLSCLFPFCLFIVSLLNSLYFLILNSFNSSILL